MKIMIPNFKNSKYINSDQYYNLIHVQDIISNDYFYIECGYLSEFYLCWQNNRSKIFIINKKKIFYRGEKIYKARNMHYKEIEKIKLKYPEYFL